MDSPCFMDHTPIEVTPLNEWFSYGWCFYSHDVPAIFPFHGPQWISSRENLNQKPSVLWVFTVLFPSNQSMSWPKCSLIFWDIMGYSWDIHWYPHFNAHFPTEIPIEILSHTCAVAPGGISWDDVRDQIPQPLSRGVEHIVQYSNSYYYYCFYFNDNCYYYHYYYHYYDYFILYIYSVTIL